MSLITINYPTIDQIKPGDTAHFKPEVVVDLDSDSKVIFTRHLRTGGIAPRSFYHITHITRSQEIKIGDKYTWGTGVNSFKVLAIEEGFYLSKRVDSHAADSGKVTELLGRTDFRIL